MSLADRLRRRIEEDGPMPFEAWMAACLYDPEGGYYMQPHARGEDGSRPPGARAAATPGQRAAEVPGQGRRRITGAGDDADFATSPTLHPFMAQALAREIAAAWDALRRPADFRVVEFGGGEGDLARDATTWLRQHTELDADWLHVERSPAHREAQKGGGTQADEMPETVGVVVAHEFLDALPFAWLERRDAEWHALAVDWQDGFCLTHVRPSADALACMPPDAPPGQRVPAMTAARQWWRQVGQRLRAGRVLVVDYGGRSVWRRDRDGTVRTFRRHAHAEAPWQAPGSQDITASLDFPQHQQWAAEAGLRHLATESQESFLVRHGALEELNAIDRDTLEGASQYLRLRQMVIGHAGGMGQAFHVARFERAD